MMSLKIKMKCMHWLITCNKISNTHLENRKGEFSIHADFKDIFCIQRVWDVGEGSVCDAGMWGAVSGDKLDKEKRRRSKD